MGTKKNIKSDDVPDIKDVDFSSDSLPDKVKFKPEDLSKVMYSYTIGLNNQLQKIQNATPNDYFNPMLSQEFASTFETNIRGATPRELTEWLKNPRQNANNLRQYGQYLLSLSQQYKRTVDLFVKTMTMKYEWIPLSDFKEIKKNKQLREEFMMYRKKTFNTLRALKIRYQYPKIVQKLCEDGIAFYYKKKTKDFITLYQLPTEYCYIVSEFDLGYRFALDLTCFDSIASLKDQLPLLYKQYEVFCQIRNMNTLNNDAIAQFQYVTIPVDMGYCFTFDMIHIDGTPPFKGAFKDAIEIGQYKNLLRTKLMLDTVQLLVQKIPQSKNGNGELIMDAIDAQKLVQASASLLPTGVKTIATPFDPECFSFSNSQQNQQLIGIGEEMLNLSTGTSSIMLGGKSNSALALGYSMEGAFGFVEHIYRQLENFTMLQISNRRFPSTIKFFGNRYKDADDLKTQQSLVQSLNAPLSKLYALNGYEPFEVESLVDYENLIGIKDKLKPILAGSQMSGKDTTKKTGREQKDATALGDAGAITREYESNQNAQKS